MVRFRAGIWWNENRGTENEKNKYNSKKWAQPLSRKKRKHQRTHRAKLLNSIVFSSSNSFFAKRIIASWFWFHCTFHHTTTYHFFGYIYICDKLYLYRSFEIRATNRERQKENFSRKRVHFTSVLSWRMKQGNTKVVRLLLQLPFRFSPFKLWNKLLFWYFTQRINNR